MMVFGAYRRNPEGRSTSRPDSGPSIVLCPLSAEAVRKRDFQGPMRERQEARQVSPAVWIVVRRRAQAALIAWMSGCTPRTAIIRFRL